MELDQFLKHGQKRQTFGLKSSKLPYLSDTGLSSTCCY